MAIGLKVEERGSSWSNTHGGWGKSMLIDSKSSLSVLACELKLLCSVQAKVSDN